MEKKLNLDRLEIKKVEMADNGVVINSTHLFEGGLISLSKHVESASHPGHGGKVHLIRTVPLQILKRIKG